MAPMQVRLRNALGLLKDQTSVSIARVASAGTPDLEVAIVKATSHEEVPSEERHMQAVLHLTSFSRANVNACVCNISRRLSKTRNWVVAIKALILAHRLLRDGDSAFEKELMLSRKQGMRVLNVCDFRDESHSNGWDFSAFVHAYGLYLDSRLDCSSFGSFGAHSKPDRKASYKHSQYEFSDSVHHSDAYESPYLDPAMKQSAEEKSRSFKDMKLSELVETLPAFQRLLERVVACRPTGPAKTNRLVSVALYGVIRESFVLYADLRDGLAMLYDAFYDMDLQDCGRVLDMYIRAAKQMNELISFYSFCKALGVCRTAEYPRVETISPDIINTMDDFIRDPNPSKLRRRLPESTPHSPEKNSKVDINEANTLPAPTGTPEAPALEVSVASPHTDSVSNGHAALLDVQEPTISPEEFGNKLALALFPGTQTNVESRWEAFPENGTAASNGVTGWELALIESQSELAKPNEGSLAGGFDRFLLENLYEQGVDRQNMLVATAPAGSASSVALPMHAQTGFLALPAPPLAVTPFTDDPFSASGSVPAPAYVQMSEMQQKQQLLVQEQQQWLQYQYTGMQGYVGPMKYPNNPFASPFQPTPYPVSYHGSNPYYV